MPFRLVCMVGDSPLRIDLAAGENLLGSDPGSDVRLSHPGVSRHHAVLLVVGRSVEVADLGSQNGTFVQGRRLTGKARLESGSHLTFGTVESHLEWLPEDDATPAVLPDFDGSVPVPAPPASLDVQDSGTASTASIAPLQLFCFAHLPRLVEELARGDGHDLGRAARTVGEALGASLPCRRLEVTCGNGVLYQASFDGADPEGTPEACQVRRSADGIEISVEFRAAAAARLYAPIVATLARLLTWRRCGGVGGGSTALPTERPGRPPLPEPATVHAGLRAIYDKAALIADSDLHVLIQGDSGTGKEILARYIHRASPRRERPMVTINCAALPKDLLEAELFGVERGVATGVEARPGRFEQAHGGTLFLDEIGDMTLPVQAKILRVLQEGEVYRLGGLEARPAKVRVISATHCDVDRMRADGLFRGDLYHRIADWRARLPTLAERAVDIPNLAAYFLGREAARRGLRTRGISRAALRVLCRHPWPGNVRQLEREVAKAVLGLGDGGLLDSHCLDPDLVAVAPPGSTLRDYLEQVERCEIVRALEATGHDAPSAARDLGLPASTLYRKIRALGIEVRERPEEHEGEAESGGEGEAC